MDVNACAIRAIHLFISDYPPRHGGLCSQDPHNRRIPGVDYAVP
jgi:hypothetical protein